MWGSAREAALRILEIEFGEREPVRDPPRATGPALAAFQAQGVARLRPVLERRGGAVLADSVGLGKTQIAVTLIEEVLREGGEVVVIVPASLRPFWRRSLGRRHSRLRLVSHMGLALGHRVPTPAGPRLLVVDEAHRFRNPTTRRYAALARLATPGTRLLLLTATPVNNHPTDLLHLLRLFSDDDGFRDLGVPSLMAAFDADAPPYQLRAVVRAVVVRRTRALVRERFDEPLPFPRRAPPRVVRYHNAVLGPRIAGIAALELRAYGPPEEAGPVAALVRLGLIKRMDSSDAAFRVSARRLVAVCDAALSAVTSGRLLDVGTEAAAWRRRGIDPLQLSLTGLLGRPAPAGTDLAGLRRSIRRDLERLDALLDAPASDPKLVALVEHLEGADEKTIVFTEYRATAEGIWRALLEQRTRVARIDGTAAWLGPLPAGRRVVVERFAPRANGRTEPPARERVDVLVATDVLAEGLNLQDARRVISYDLPWNPVRLLQRIGRVDRLGSPHAEIQPVLFVPSADVEAMIRLVRTVRSKLDSIASTVGAEHAEALLDALAAEGSEVRLDQALRGIEAEQDDPVERLRTLWVGADAARLPSGEGPDDGDQPRVPCLGRLIVDRCHPAAGLAWVVALRVRFGSGGPTRPQLLAIGRDGTASEADHATVAAVASAIESETSREKRVVVAESDGAGSAGPPGGPIQEFLRERGVRSAAPARLAMLDPGTRLARRVQREVARAGARLDPTTLAVADSLLRRLRSPLGPAERSALRSLLRDHPSDPRPSEIEHRARRARRLIRQAAMLIDAQDDAVDTAPSLSSYELLAGLEIIRGDLPRTG